MPNCAKKVSEKRCIKWVGDDVSACDHGHSTCRFEIDARAIRVVTTVHGSNCLLLSAAMAFSNKQLAALLFSDAGSGKRQCRLCGKHYARGNGYTNLLTHLRGSHADYEARALEAANRRQQRRQAGAQAAAPAAHEAPATATAVAGAGPNEEEEAKASEAPTETPTEATTTSAAAPSNQQAKNERAEHRRVEAECERVAAALSTLGKRRRSAVATITTPPPATVEDAVVLPPPEKQRKLAQLPASMHEVYAMHSARKMELAHKKLRAELALQERRLSLEAAKERNRTVLELVKLGKTPEEIEKLMPLFS